MAVASTTLQNIKTSFQGATDALQKANVNVTLGHGTEAVLQAVATTVVPRIGTAISEVGTALATSVLPQVGEAIIRFEGDVNGNILRPVGKIITEVGNTVHGASQFLPRINTAIVGIANNIEATTIPKINAALDRSRTFLTMGIVFLVILILTCIAIIIAVIYFIYRDAQEKKLQQLLISVGIRPMVVV